MDEQDNIRFDEESEEQEMIVAGDGWQALILIR